MMLEEGVQPGPRRFLQDILCAGQFGQQNQECVANAHTSADGLPNFGILVEEPEPAHNNMDHRQQPYRDECSDHKHATTTVVL